MEYALKSELLFLCVLGNLGDEFDAYVKCLRVFWGKKILVVTLLAPVRS